MSEKINTKQVQDLYNFLQGEKNHKLLLRKNPKLSKNGSFSIIYYLQEVMNIIPDSFEVCDRCGDIFDCSNEGDCLPDNFEEFINIDLTNANFTKKDAGKKYCDSCFDEICYGRR